MRSSSRSRVPKVGRAAVLAAALVIGSAGSAVAAKPKPPPPSPPPTVQIAASGTVEPNRQYALVDVTVTCAVGWTWSYGRLYVLQDGRGGAGTFSAACTGTPQVARARVVNGNKFQLGNWTATAYVGVVRNGQEVTATSSRTIRLEPGVTARVADQGQLTGTTGGGASIAVSVACPTGATGLSSFVSVSQGGTAQGTASFTPTCDDQTRTLVLSLTASQGTFHTGSAVGDAFVTVSWNGEGFYGIDNRSITLLESSTGDTTPPTTPTGLYGNLFSSGDGETELIWGASTDNATPTALMVYEVYLNGRFDHAVGFGLTRTILYADLNTLNTIQVFAVDGAGNRSAPATTFVDTRW